MEFSRLFTASLFMHAKEQASEARIVGEVGGGGGALV